VSAVKLGLCSSRPDGLLSWPAQSSLENAVQFFQVSETGSVEGGMAAGECLSLARFDASAADLEQSLREAADNDVTHILFLSPRTLLPFYSLQRLIDMDVSAVTGVSWTWMPGGEGPDIFPRIGFFDPEGRPYPYFGWTAPGLFEVDWCGLDCLLLSRGALEEIAGPVEWVRGKEPALRISQCLRMLGIPILVDASVQCPRVVSPPLAPCERSRHRLVPSPRTWREFSRDCPARSVPRGHVFDPAYRGRSWYRDWTAAITA
jgi:hypothetical protein